MLHIEERRVPIPENVKIYANQYEIFNNLLTKEMGNILEATS
jgi:hypothetical protein